MLSLCHLCQESRGWFETVPGLAVGTAQGDTNLGLKHPVPSPCFTVGSASLLCHLFPTPLPFSAPIPVSDQPIPEPPGTGSEPSGTEGSVSSALCNPALSLHVKWRRPREQGTLREAAISRTRVLLLKPSQMLYPLTAFLGIFDEQVFDCACSCPSLSLKAQFRRNKLFSQARLRL